MSDRTETEDKLIAVIEPVFTYGERTQNQKMELSLIFEGPKFQLIGKSVLGNGTGTQFKLTWRSGMGLDHLIENAFQQLTSRRNPRRRRGSLSASNETARPALGAREKVLISLLDHLSCDELDAIDQALLERRKAMRDEMVGEQTELQERFDKLQEKFDHMRSSIQFLKDETLDGKAQSEGR